MESGDVRLLWIRTDLLDDSPENGLFRRFTDEELAEFSESLREVGMIHPPVVRPKGGRFEIVSGHQRVRAARFLGWEEIPCLVRDLPDEHAVAQMIDANIRARVPGPMEIARAIARRAEALGTRQGERTDLRLPEPGGTSGTKFLKLGEQTRDVLGKEFGMTGRQAEKYLRLNDLIPELQAEVESGRLDPSKGYELALLSPDTQRALLEWRGSGFGEMTVAEVRQLRRRLEEAEREKAQAVEQLRRELAEARKRLEEAERREPQVVERTVLVLDPNRERELSHLRAEVEKLNAELARVTSQSAVEAAKAELERVQRELEKARNELAWTNRLYERRRSAVTLLNLAEKVLGPLESAREEFFERLRTAELNTVAQARLEHALGVLRQYVARIEEALRTMTVDAVEAVGKDADGSHGE
ncbi:MAG: ParB N-terminal domain-containing protein [Bacillota bacterium]